MSQVKKEFTSILLAWYREHGRYDLPWQKSFDWYPRLLSEVMLQQTQVTTVIPKFEAFIEKYPTPEALACAKDDDVMALWAGLGYYSRARNLLKAVRMVVNELGGICPSTVKELQNLPGIGLSTAGAIASFVFKERAVMADGNAQRVLSRVFLVEGRASETLFKKKIWLLAESLLPEKEEMPAYTQALMDFGALQCTRNPKCDDCPLADICAAKKADRVAEFPGKKIKRERPIRYLAVVFPFFGQEVWLQKKEEKGVWKDLWIPLVKEVEEPPIANNIPRICGLTDDVLERCIVFEQLIHDFTHYRVQIYPVSVDLTCKCLSLQGLWLSPEEDGQVGMPSPLAKLLENIRSYRRMLPTSKKS
ncbi:A/G-specific adenine DNA glycosylase [gut metagenome]|uniref:Adenine DNA glycosylase n=1 Tax=gut metagenome TaxID=749906 RepID=J9GIY5_9ZZZZ